MTDLRAVAVRGLPLVVFAGFAWWYRGFFVDDAFISFRYVEQLVAGNGLVYNLDERVEGFSNLLWILLLAPARAAGADLVLASKIMGFLLGLGTLVLVASWSRRLPCPWIAPLVLAVSAPFVAWSMGGLETPLFAFLVTASTLAFVRALDRGPGLFAGVLFGLTAWARPEGLLFGLVAILFVVAHRRRPGSTPLRAWRRGLVVFALLAAAPFVFRLLYYGDWLPNTVHAKSMGLLHLRTWMEGGYYAYRALVVAGGPIGLVIPLLLLVRQTRIPSWITYLAANVAAYGGFIVSSGGDWMPMERFLVHVLPLLVVLLHAGLAELASLWTASRRTVVLVALAALHVGYLLLATLEQRWLVERGAGAAAIDVHRSPVVAHLRRHLGEDDTIAVDRAGALGYGLPLDVRVIDVNGLVDRHIARRPPRFPGGLFGRGDGFGKWDVDYVLAQAPRFVQLAVRGIDEEGTVHTTNTGQTLLANDPRFRQRYRMATGPGLYGLFVRTPDAAQPSHGRR